jgi:hypothetical protein
VTDIQIEIAKQLIAAIKSNNSTSAIRSGLDDIAAASDMGPTVERLGGLEESLDNLVERLGGLEQSLDDFVAPQLGRIGDALEKLVELLAVKVG